MDISILALFLLAPSSAYSTPFCFSNGVTWSSPVTGGIQHVETPEECQLLCADYNHCDLVTWYDGEASPHPDYCEMFLSPDAAEEIPCENCSSGPQSCTCSNGYTCSLESNQVVDLIFAVSNEISCAELCFQSPDCTHYSWYSPEDITLKEACALLRGCSQKSGSTTCTSGPSDCKDVDILIDEYPLCYTAGLTWVEESRGIPNISSPYVCQELCEKDEECSSFTWFSTLALPYPNVCEFYKEEVSKPMSPCTDCISGPAPCTCSVSTHQTCNSSKEFVIDVIQEIESEVRCQDICDRHKDCSWYSWYSGEGVPLQFICILLESCTNKMDCVGCYSGPANCEDKDILSLPTECNSTVYKELSSYTRNVITPTGNLCGSGAYAYCCDQVGSHAPSDWEGDGWYRFTGAAGSRLAEERPLYHVCGVDYGGYMLGGHPTVSDGKVQRTAYFDNSGDTPANPTEIEVINCRDFFVYYLVDVPDCAYGYCGL